jgi:hypothetical protein
MMSSIFGGCLYRLMTTTPLSLQTTYSEWLKPYVLTIYIPARF